MGILKKHLLCFELSRVIVGCAERERERKKERKKERER
jgi:hypothetical protein